jgi:hypothetical protein
MLIAPYCSLASLQPLLVRELLFQAQVNEQFVDVFGRRRGDTRRQESPRSVQAISGGAIAQTLDLQTRSGACRAPLSGESSLDATNGL